jgi:hypothetical protein
LALALLAACDVSLGSPSTAKQPEPLLLSLGEGSTLRRGDVVDVTVQLADVTRATTTAGGTSTDQPSTTTTPSATAAAYSVEVDLESSSGMLITTRTFPYADGETLPPLTLDDLGLESRGYRLVIRLLRGKEVLARKTVEFFYMGDEYEIKEITSDAPSVHPGSTVALKAVLKTPAGSDPFLSWKSSSGVFAKGKVRDGADAAQWTSPSVEGIYTITATLFPLGEGNASVSLSADIYVKVVKDPVGELEPATAYRGLYHLLGELADASPARENGSFLGGEPMVLLTRGRVVGYRLDGTSGYSVPAFLIPTREGEFDPFSVEIGFTPAEPPAEGQLVRMSTADGSVELTLGVGPDLAPRAELRLGRTSSTLVADSARLRPGTRSSLTFSLYPVAGEPASEPAAERAAANTVLVATWFVDGEPVGTADWSTKPHVSDARGTTIVGGASSATGLLDELGVFVKDAQGRPAPDPGVYRRRAVELHGPSTVADGFDGMYLGPDYTTTGAITVGRGRLSIAADAAVRLPAYRVEGTGTRFELDFDSLNPQSLVRLSFAGETGAAAEILTIAGSGELTHDGITEQYRIAADRKLVLTLYPEGEKVRVEIQGLVRDGAAAPTFDALRGERTTLSISVALSEGAKAPAPLVLDSFTFWQLP